MAVVSTVSSYLLDQGLSLHQGIHMCGVCMLSPCCCEVFSGHYGFPLQSKNMLSLMGVTDDVRMCPAMGWCPVLGYSLPCAPDPPQP